MKIDSQEITITVLQRALIEYLLEHGEKPQYIELSLNQYMEYAYIHVDRTDELPSYFAGIPVKVVEGDKGVILESVL